MDHMAERAAKKRRLSGRGGVAAAGGRRGAAAAADSVRGFASYDLEADYAQRWAQRKRRDTAADRLAIKTADGRVVANPRAEEPAARDNDGGGDDEVRDAAGAGGAVAGADGPPPPPRSAAPPRLPPKEELRRAKEELARLAQSLSEDPEEHVGQLSALAALARSAHVVVRKAALATQAAVFKDLIPGYRIRPLGEKDRGAKVGKDVKKLRNFEQGLLQAYTHYVATLASTAAATATKTLPQQAASSLASVAISCACTLLTAVPHFNNRADLIGILVRKLGARNVDADFVKCQAAIEQLFREDDEGHVSLDVVTQLTKLIKTKNYSVHEEVLNTFLHLRLLSEFAHKAAPNRIEEASAKKPKPKKDFRTKRERKILKERKQVEKELKEADAAVSYEERDKNHAETLKLVFVAYFRILKERVPHLMGAVLEGLAKYSHLINQDFFGDVLEVLKDLIRDAEAALHEDGDQDPRGDRNVVRESLLCIVTAFALLQGQVDVAKSANALSLDLSFFTRHLYQTLISLSMDPDIERGAATARPDDPHAPRAAPTASNQVNVATTTVLLLRSLHSALLPPTNTKSVPPVRVAAFVRHLTTLALHLPPKSALAVLELLKAVSKVHGKKVAALWHTEERTGDGLFHPLSADMDASNPFASTAWEGELLRRHFHPAVRAAVTAIERNVADARS